MRQGWSVVSSCAAIALIACGALAPLEAHAAKAAAGSKSSTASATKSKSAYRQFTGYVTAVDKTSITVEKRGKNPTSRVFVRHAEMNTTGDVAKDARVTVYYRDDGGRAVAHRVVVKSETAQAVEGN
jgi:hypothetical protein